MSAPAAAPSESAIGSASSLAMPTNNVAADASTRTNAAA
jgi:hypothetical protein